jgi:iron complex transport system substrate-binding protein
MTAGPQSFIGELLVLGNMDNIFHDTVNRYPRVNSESVVERNPDVILAPTTHGEKVKFETLANRAGWENVAAIKNQQVFLIDGDQVSRCGPRLLDALESMIQQVYPEALAKKE